jgi:phage baseplate assembly protein W
MAIKQTNIFPIDLQPRNAVGLSFPFSNSAVSGSIPFKLNYTTQDQIKSNIVVYLSTNKGERPLNPNYGGGLKNFLFEQLSANTFSDVESVVRRELASQFPQVTLKKVEVLGSPDSYTLTVVITYSVFNNETDTLSINFNP